MTTLAARRTSRKEFARLVGLMRTPWSEREGTTLSDIYDPDLRSTEPGVRALAATVMVPHPLVGVAYADGTWTAHKAAYGKGPE